MSETEALQTPALLLDAGKLDRNVARMKAALAPHRVKLRPHVKTAKCHAAYKGALDGGGVAVSTLAEAEYAFAHGEKNILYAVGIAPAKLDRALALIRNGADLTLTLDSLEAARAVSAAGEAAGVRIPAVIEIDSDDHRAGVKPQSQEARAIARHLDAAAGARFRGLMTHAGGSYDCRSIEEIRAVAERERAAVADTAAMLERDGMASEIVSVGSTPTALFGASFAGVTEVRAGVFLFMDLVMAGLGVCAADDIALSVLASVIGRQDDKGWVLIDAGWTALSRDRGTKDHAVDQGYGLVCDAAGRPLGDLIVAMTNQEHGIVTRRGGGRLDPADFPVGRRLRILPNHACATATQFSAYDVVGGDGRVAAQWPRFSGW